MNLPREPFSWDGDDDRPVPPDDLWSGQDSWKASDEAELIVRDAQAAIAREDTDPNISTPKPERGPEADFRVSLRQDPLQAINWRRVRRSLVAVACLLAFAHGWATGASEHRGFPSGACGVNHCPPDSIAIQWKEEQL